MINKKKENKKIKLLDLTKEEMVELQEKIKKLNSGLNISLLTEEELFLQNKEGLPFIEFLITQDCELYGLDEKIKTNPQIILLFIKHLKSLEKYDISTELLLSKYEGKKIIDYIVENNYYLICPEI